MKLQFDANQKFQQDAIRAVVDLFDGQPLQQQGVQVTIHTSSTDPLFSGTQQTELGLGNALLPNDAALLKNVHAVQERNDIDPSPTLHPVVGYGKAQDGGLAPRFTQ